MPGQHLAIARDSNKRDLLALPAGPVDLAFIICFCGTLSHQICLKVIDTSFSGKSRYSGAFHAQEASRIFRVFTALFPKQKEKKKHLKENGSIIVNSKCVCRLRRISSSDL